MDVFITHVYFAMMILAQFIVGANSQEGGSVKEQDELVKCFVAEQ